LWLPQELLYSADVLRTRADMWRACPDLRRTGCPLL
jgi:hypothetical protein